MKAIDLTGQAPGGERRKLEDVLPLDTPILLQFFPIYACNLKCRYCVFSIPFQERNFISSCRQMEWSLFEKCINDAKKFPHPIEVIRFVGMGEPLLHPELPNMIAYTIDSKITKKTEVITNGTLLNHNISRKLIDSRLSSIIISIQGVTSKKYFECSGKFIDIDKLVSEIKFLYENKTDMRIYIKIIDLALDDKSSKDKFFELFGDICDFIAVENAGPIYPGVDFNSEIEARNTEHTQFGYPVVDVKICPQPFFTIQINPDGNVVPCYSVSYPTIVGNCYEESIVDIWNGRKLKNFRKSIIQNRHTASDICKDCKIITYRIFPEDILDNAKERLWSIYQ